MLIKELPALAGDATTIVWVGGARADDLLRALLPAAAGIQRLPYDPDASSAFDAQTLVVASIGPDPEVHIAPEALAAALRRMSSGGRLVLLLGWPIEQLPYHVLLGPLVDAGLQVLQGVPLDNAKQHGVHCAVVAARVSRLAPPRTYLDDTPIAIRDDEPDLRTLLRLAGEHTFSDLVSRPMRRRLAELHDRVESQQQRMRELEEDVRAGEAKVTAAQESLARLRSSLTFQVGETIAQGARRPGRAIVSVPAGLVRVWRHRLDRRTRTPSGR